MSQSRSVDGSVLSVSKDRIDACESVATVARALWKGQSALKYRECRGDDQEVEVRAPFLQLAGTQADETVILSCGVLAFRDARDEANARIMAAPRIAEICEATRGIFDTKRMACGGFQTLVHQ